MKIYNATIQISASDFQTIEVFANNIKEAIAKASKKGIVTSCK